MKIFIAFLIMLSVALARAGDVPYDETADAKADIKNALSQATAAHQRVVVVFGANWCGDCKMLDKAIKSGASAPLFVRAFQVVKVNVGRFDKNLDVVKSYSVPLEKGIPEVAILSTNNEVLYLTREGELSDARKMGDDGVYQFFKKVTGTVAAKQ